MSHSAIASHSCLLYTSNVLLDESVDLEAIALATSGAVGSDLANMINEAAILAVKKGRNAVSQKDLFEAVEVVLVGKEKKDRIMSKEERRIVSYHEVDVYKRQIASNLAMGCTMEESVRKAKAYLTGALKDGMDLGHGSGPLNHCYWL